MVLQIILFDLLTRNSLYYQKNTCSGQSTSYQAVLKSQTWRERSSSNYIWPKMMKRYKKSTFLQISGGSDARVLVHAKGYSETSPVMQLNKDIFWSQSLKKYLTNETCFCSHQCKFNIDSKNAREMLQKHYGCLDSFIWIGNYKFSLLLREYS